ncbi:MAG: hypothetical protein ACI8RD_002935 [Bacillariaceae sp.]|jgi:hypothetical protein
MSYIAVAPWGQHEFTIIIVECDVIVSQELMLGIIIN